MHIVCISEIMVSIQIILNELIDSGKYRILLVGPKIWVALKFNSVVPHVYRQNTICNICHTSQKDLYMYSQVPKKQ